MDSRNSILMNIRLTFMLATIATAPLLLFMFGIKVFVVYALIWIDKILIGVIRPARFVGIETTTTASIIMAIFYGPAVSFFSVLFLFTFLQSIRYFIFPLRPPDYPLFVPNKDSIIYAAGAALAGILNLYDFATIIIIVLVFKSFIYGITDFLVQKKPDFFITFGGTVIIHVIFFLPIGVQIMNHLK